MRGAIFRDGDDGMSVEQTLTRWSTGKESWNAWAEALLERKEKLLDSGEWAANPFGEGENAATREWLEEARADFSDQVFPENVHFADYVFPGPVNFSNCAFSDGANFDGARFEAAALFPKARFEAAARFKGVRFAGIADFDQAVFTADADFERAQFAMVSDSPLVIAARFSRCVFAERADFREARFSGNAKFARSRFASVMRFDEADFTRSADFACISTQGIAAFAKTRFAADASFADAQFEDEARFADARFQGGSVFDRAIFATDTLFRACIFDGGTSFEDAKFAGRAGFSATRFAAPVNFAGTHYQGAADFSTARFEALSSFRHAVCHAPMNVEGATFLGEADLSGLRAETALSLAETRFALAPDFLNAQIRQPPRLDNIRVAAPMRRFRRWRIRGMKDPRPWPFRLMKVARDGLEAARFRQLRHLARTGLDHEREGFFYAQELQAARFWRDQPLGRGAGRFWYGWLYGGIANFGQSVLRPLILWLVTTFAFALVYLGLRDAPAPADVTQPNFPPWPEAPSFQTITDWLPGALEWLFQTVVSVYNSGSCLVGSGSASAEALYLSFKNSVFFLPWESTLAAQRVYGCLYGVENGAPAVPLAASVAAFVQNIFGFVFIALVILALRNMLKRG